MKAGSRPAVLAALALAAAGAAGEPRIVLSPRTPRGEIAVMHPLAASTRAAFPWTPWRSCTRPRRPLASMSRSGASP